MIDHCVVFYPVIFFSFSLRNHAFQFEKKILVHVTISIVK